MSKQGLFDKLFCVYVARKARRGGHIVERDGSSSSSRSVDIF